MSFPLSTKTIDLVQASHCSFFERTALHGSHSPGSRFSDVLMNSFITKLHIMPTSIPSNLGFKYLSQTDVQNSKIFFHILQAQKDGMHNYFAAEQKLFLNSLSKIQKNKNMPKVANVANLRLLRTKVLDLHDELEEILADFKQALSDYDELHCTKTQEEELEDLLSTHKFMDGSWTSSFCAVLDESIASQEKKKIAAPPKDQRKRRSILRRFLLPKN